MSPSGTPIHRLKNPPIASVGQIESVLSGFLPTEPLASDDDEIGSVLADKTETTVQRTKSDYMSKGHRRRAVRVKLLLVDKVGGTTCSGPTRYRQREAIACMLKQRLWIITQIEQSTVCNLIWDSWVLRTQFCCLKSCFAYHYSNGLFSRIFESISAVGIAKLQISPGTAHVCKFPRSAALSAQIARRRPACIRSLS